MLSRMRMSPEFSTWDVFSDIVGNISEELIENISNSSGI